MGKDRRCTLCISLLCLAVGVWLCDGSSSRVRFARCWRLATYDGWSPCTEPCGPGGVRTRAVDLERVRDCLRMQQDLAPTQACLPGSLVETEPCNRFCPRGSSMGADRCVCSKYKWGECCHKKSAWGMTLEVPNHVEVNSSFNVTVMVFVPVSDGGLVPQNRVNVYWRQLPDGELVGGDVDIRIGVYRVSRRTTTLQMDNNGTRIQCVITGLNNRSDVLRTIESNRIRVYDSASLPRVEVSTQLQYASIIEKHIPTIIQSIASFAVVPKNLIKKQITANLDRKQKFIVDISIRGITKGGQVSQQALRKLLNEIKQMCKIANVPAGRIRVTIENQSMII